MLVLLSSTQTTIPWSQASPDAARMQLEHSQVAQVTNPDGTPGDQSMHKDGATTTAIPIVANGGAPAKPPRGYCVRISRAIKPTSRCFKHLVQTVYNHHYQLDIPAEQQQQLLTKQERQRQASDLAQETTQATAPNRVPNLAPNQKQLNGPLRGARHHHEELVYVRSETLGDKITNLSTQAINEHLINGLLARLMSPSKPVSAADVVDVNEQQEARMQIVGSLSSECRLGIEKFLCRLVYPSCHFRSIDVVALVRPPCREDCLLLREHSCASLNWTQFSQTIQEAFKATLMSTINALDLLVDGDPSAQLPSMDVLGDLPPHKSSDDSTAKQNALDSSRQQGDAKPTTDGPRRANWSASGAPDHNLSSSIHFYWPHERSIERCESLPILWPPSPTATHVGAADVGRRTNSGSVEKRSAMEAKQLRRWLRDHRTRNYWPVCSNAHLTETNELN